MLIYLRAEHMGHKLLGLRRSFTHLKCVNHEVGASGVCGELVSRQKLLNSHSYHLQIQTKCVCGLCLTSQKGDRNNIIIYFKVFEILYMYKTKM